MGIMVYFLTMGHAGFISSTLSPKELVCNSSLPESSNPEAWALLKQAQHPLANVFISSAGMRGGLEFKV